MRKYAFAFGQKDPHLFRGDGDAGQGLGGLRLAGGPILIDKADAFVGHKDSLQGSGFRGSVLSG